MRCNPFTGFDSPQISCLIPIHQIFVDEKDKETIAIKLNFAFLSLDKTTAIHSPFLCP